MDKEQRCLTLLKIIKQNTITQCIKILAKVKLLMNDHLNMDLKDWTQLLRKISLPFAQIMLYGLQAVSKIIEHCWDTTNIMYFFLIFVNFPSSFSNAQSSSYRWLNMAHNAMWVSFKDGCLRGHAFGHVFGQSLWKQLAWIDSKFRRVWDLTVETTFETKIVWKLFNWTSMFISCWPSALYFSLI